MKRALVVVALILAGCGGSSGTSSPTTTARTTTARTVIARSGFRLISSAFRPGGAIPRLYTCDGRDTPLPLRWAGVPRATKEFVLVMRDPDAPGGTFVHWAVAGMPPSARTVPTRGVVVGRNSFGSVGYRGPCPPAGGKPHHYVLTLSALAAPSGVRSGFNPDQLRSRAVGVARLIGTYARR